MESRIKSIKNIRFQCPQRRLARLKLYECCDNDGKKSMCIDAAIKQLESMLSYFENYWKISFTKKKMLHLK